MSSYIGLFTYKVSLKNVIGVLNLRIQYGNQTITDNDSTNKKIPNNQLKLLWNNMYNFNPSDNDFGVNQLVYLDGSLSGGEINQQYFKRIKSYMIFAFVSNVKIINDSAPDPHPTSNISTGFIAPGVSTDKGKWLLIDEVPAEKINDTDIVYNVSDLPLGIFVGFWVGCKSEETIPSKNLEMATKNITLE